ncbi:hypothetical protein Scep_001678 [Stephania cephalantha]|uniref:Uncharacterized protein n=1 Tax=Stephania cephalantha TaxID=152367 RepID=A0AAP0L9V6_9MAGN
MRTIEKWERMLGLLPSLRLRLRFIVGSARGRVVCHRCLRSPRHLSLLPLKPSSSAVAASESFALCRRCLRSPRHLPSLALKPSSSTVAASEAFALCHHCLNVREVAELYGSEKLFVVEVHRALSGLHSIALIALERRRQELTQATPDQLVDDEAVYFNVVGECPKGRVYGLGSLGRKKRRYADPGVSTSQLPNMVPRSEFDSVVEQLRLVVAFVQRQFAMTMDGAGLSQPQPQPPPPPHERQHPQIDPVNPPQQQDNVDREMQDWLMRYEQLGDT